MKPNLRSLLLMLVIVFGGASGVLYFFGRTGAEEVARAQAIVDENNMRELCANLEPNAVEKPRCDEYYATKKADAEAANKGGK